MRFIKIVLAFMLALGGSAVLAPAAFAHTPSVTATCDALSVNLVKYQATKNKVNEVKVWVDGVKVADDKFKTDWSQVFVLDPSWQSHTYKVRVHAQDDPNFKKGWSFVKEGTTDPCIPEKPSKEDVVEVVEGAPNCDTREVLITTTTTKFDYWFDDKTGQWVETSSQEIVVTTREATTEECPVVTTPPTTEPPVTTPPTTTPPVTTPPTTNPPVTTPPVVTTPPAPEPTGTTVQRRSVDTTDELAATGLNTAGKIVVGVILVVVGICLALLARAKA